MARTLARQSVAEDRVRDHGRRRGGRPAQGRGFHGPSARIATRQLRQLSLHKSPMIARAASGRGVRAAIDAAARAAAFLVARTPALERPRLSAADESSRERGPGTPMYRRARELPRAAAPPRRTLGSTRRDLRQRPSSSMSPISTGHARLLPRRAVQKTLTILVSRAGPAGGHVPRRGRQHRLLHRPGRAPCREHGPRIRVRAPPGRARATRRQPSRATAWRTAWKSAATRCPTSTIKRSSSSSRRTRARSRPCAPRPRRCRRARSPARFRCARRRSTPGCWTHPCDPALIKTGRRRGRGPRLSRHGEHAARPSPRAASSAKPLEAAPPTRCFARYGYRVQSLEASAANVYGNFLYERD